MNGPKDYDLPEVDAGKALAQVADDYIEHRIDGVCGFTAALSDRPDSRTQQFVLFQTRVGESEIPPERAAALARAFADRMRNAAVELDRLAAEFEREIAGPGPGAEVN